MTPRSFYHRLTGIENLSFFASLDDLHAGIAAIRIKNVVDIVGLGAAAQRPVRTYSRGMQQKLGLARALLRDPAVLLLDLLDEPTKSLDPRAAEEFWRFLRGTLAREMKKTILMVTHNLQEARSCDRVAFMYGGRVAAIGEWCDVESHIRRHGFEEEIVARA